MDQQVKIVLGNWIIMSNHYPQCFIEKAGWTTITDENSIVFFLHDFLNELDLKKGKLTLEEIAQRFDAQEPNTAKWSWEI